MSNALLICVDYLRGELSETTFEMLGIGRKLADAMQVPLYAVVLGSEGAALVGHLGAADKVLLVDDAKLNHPTTDIMADAVSQVMEAKQISIAFIAGTNVAMGMGTLISARLNRPFVSFCRKMIWENGEAKITSQLFGGKIFSDVVLPAEGGIVSIYPGSFPADAGKSTRTPETEKVALSLAVSKVTFKRYIEPEKGDVDITKQNLLVGVGRGIQSQDNLALAEELAEALGGAVCASRPVIDQGWMPLSRQVGKSGMTVKPRAYLAFGISGAPEHWEGMQASQTIIAVNTDPKAPIFDGAHYGVCQDALELLPILTEKIKARKG